MSSEPSAFTGILPLLLAAFVVVRFAFRELRQRTVRVPQIWIRPALLLALTGYLTVLTFSVDSRDDALAVGSLLVAVVLGIGAGLAIVRNTVFAAAGTANAVRVQGNRWTLGIWIGVLAFRLLVRFLWPGGGSLRAQLPLNCGTVALVAVAFVIIALAAQSAIARFAAAPAAPAPAATVLSPSSTEPALPEPASPAQALPPPDPVD